MAERIKTVGCSFAKLVPDPEHAAAIEGTVNRVHRCTILATELLNLLVRDRLANHGGAGLDRVFDANWLLNAYNEVTAGRGSPKVDADLRAVRDRCMPAFEPVNRQGLTQILMYECRNLAAVGSTNVWRHFQRRLLGHVRHALALGEDAYKALTKDERRARRLDLMRVSEDLARPTGEPFRSAPERHAWIAAERARLGIDAAVGDWADKPLLYHLKAKPHAFLMPMYRMALDREACGAKSFALLPMRRTLTPRHIRFDQKALRGLLRLGGSDFQKQAEKRRRTEAGRVDLHAEPVGRKRRSKDEMVDEKREAFNRVLDLRAAGVSQPHLFDFAFTTDGVCARLQYKMPSAGEKIRPRTPPTRGRWSIDELKRVGRLDQLHVVGVDPGKRELVVAVDTDDAKNTPLVRYTQRQRQKDMRSRQYTDEATRSATAEVRDGIAAQAGTNSRAAGLDAFVQYLAQRRSTMDVGLAHFGELAHRRRRWKACIKAQQSEERLYARLAAMHRKDDTRTLVLAYGSWGLVAGRPETACNKGNPPTIGVGLMNKLSKRFVVALTPEQFTSKTCCKCLGPAGPWTQLETDRGNRIRGLRRCQNESCMLPQNRDRTGASNIGLQFRRLFEDLGPIRSMTDEELEFHRLNVCVECDAE